MGFSDYHWYKVFNPVANRPSWQILPMIMQPKSKGKILLASKDARVKPRIIPNYFSDPDDIRVMIKGIRAALEISKTPDMQRYGSKLHLAPIPGCRNFAFNSDAYWECALRTYTMTIYHHAGSCKMGPDNDPTSVVDPRLKVKIHLEPTIEMVLI